MKIRQNIRHWAAKKALTTPVIGDVANDKLVDLHTKIFLEKADENRQEERREHLDDFFVHGWTEMMEIPGDELEDHYRRYEAFFVEHGITIDDPLGGFRPTDGIADAPETPEKLEQPEYENAIAGFADDVYVETGDGGVADDRRHGDGGVVCLFSHTRTPTGRSDISII